jgi:hypothetical protein
MAMHRIEQDVAVARTTVAIQQLCFGDGEQRLAGSDRIGIDGRHRRLSLEVERIADVFQPHQPEGR